MRPTIDRPLVPAVRAYTPGRAPARAKRRDWRPKTLLVYDAETELSAAQSLLCLSYLLIRVSWNGSTPLLSCVEEGLVYGDGLPDRNPAAFEVLDRYRQTHAPSVDAAILDAAYRLRLRSRAEFVEEVLYPAAADAAGLRAWVVTYNAGWDLSRLMAPPWQFPTAAGRPGPGSRKTPRRTSGTSAPGPAGSPEASRCRSGSTRSPGACGMRIRSIGRALRSATWAPARTSSAGSEVGMRARSSGASAAISSMHSPCRRP